jgi:hypothetical protein
LYKAAIRYALENQENLSLFQQAVEDLIIEDDVVKGVKTQKEFDNVKQRDQNNKLHQQNEQQKLTGRLEAADQNLVEHLDTPETQTSLDNSKDIIALAKSTTTLTPAKSTTIIGYNYCDAHFVRFCLTHAIPHHFLGFGFGFGFGFGQEIKDSEKGIKQSNEKTQKEFDNVKQRDQNNKLHQQNEQQKLRIWF